MGLRTLRAALLATSSLLLAPSVGAEPLDPSALPEAWRGLFSAGAHWRWDVRESDIHMDEEGGAPGTESRMRRGITCSVAGVRRFEGAVAAFTTCNAEAPTHESLWVATSEGLWLTGAEDLPADAGPVRRLLADPPWLAAAPKLGRSRETKDAPCYVDVTRGRARAWGGSRVDEWCVRSGCDAGDESWSTFCFYAGGGPSRYERTTVAAASEYIVEATASPALPGAVVAFAEPAPPELTGALIGWAYAQNHGSLHDYQLLYGDDFEGIKRTRRDKVTRYTKEAWIRDRKPMLAKGMQVVLRALRAVALSPEEVEAGGYAEGAMRVTFQQYWRSPTYADVGTKEMIWQPLAKTWRIRREEMKDARQWDGHSIEER